MHANHKPAAPGLGTNLRRLRLKAGLSLHELGDKCNLTHASLSFLERGITKGNLGTIKRIADALGCRVENLVKSA